MTFAHRLLLFLLAAMMYAGCAPQPLSAQAPATTASATTASTASPISSPQPAYHLPPAQLARAVALSRIRNLLDIAGSLWAIAVLWLLLAGRIAAQMEKRVARITGRCWLQGLLFFAAFLIITTLAGLPLDLYGQYAERSFQISVQGWPGWFWDQAKSLGLTLALGAPLLLFFNWIVRRWPRRYWLGAWLATLPILVATVFVAPLIGPLFDTFEPLSLHHVQLVQQLEKVVARTGTRIPPDRMFLMQASAKTNGLNAYVTGIGATKRIVVWDTTAGRIPNNEILFIFAHETGHYVLHHLPKGIALTAAGLFFVYWGCSACAAWLARRCGARWGATDLASRTGFVVLLFTIAVAGFLLQPVSNAVSRHFEHQADVYGQEAIHGIVPDPQKTAVAAFNDLGQAWLEDPSPNPLIEFWLYSHPSTEHRAEFAQHYNPWANGGHGKFFAH
ncbi:MAG TPA: M48 family metallopeptidase [Terracidiphilus sp.]|jgi:Zn-dependent protease with chaperone function|nr:M48 family metallopeptidase [Terracidiphilus sp.]